MLPSSNRLPAFEIRSLMRSGRRVSQGAVTLIYQKAMTPRFSFVVSTSVDKRATVRNRMKRLLREAVRHVLPTAPPVDGVFIARKGLPDTQGEVDAIVRELLTRPDPVSLDRIRPLQQH